MRERLDCAILGFGDTTDWHGKKDGVYARGRLYLHRVAHPSSAEDNIQVLAQMATQLQRFDVCLLAVGQDNLSWTRQALLAARPKLRTPVIGLVRNLKAPAIGDLYNLGMADFVREPLCVEEIRIRTERLLDQSRHDRGSAYANRALQTPDALHDKSKCYQPGGDIAAASAVLAEHARAFQESQADTDAVHRATELALEEFARASASQCSASGDSFGIAKSRVVQSFERTYIHASLAKSSGNIAQAARGAKKHRRAFWALMRKHNIDATPYRKVMPPNR